jgi:hypothetical protein
VWFPGPKKRKEGKKEEEKRKRKKGISNECRERKPGKTSAHTLPIHSRKTKIGKKHEA